VEGRGYEGGNKSQHNKYAGSNSIGDVAWYDNNSGRVAHPVKGKWANELGLYDMSGNLYEWCSDWKGSYDNSSQINPKGPSTGSSRVLRGGYWNALASYCRVSYRNYYYPDYRDIDYGFRLALVRQ
jgi:formylglycine-generating enzyme required for sulfatase activity